jgi:hypothetical protein
MIKRGFKIALGILMIPASFSFAYNLFKQISNISSVGNVENYFFYGIAAYVVLHIVFFKPIYLYVLGHEALHVLATWICGGKVTSFKVSSAGGSVETTKANFFVALAPYLFPFYTIVTSLIFGGMSLLMDVSSFVPIFIFALGFTLVFHLIMTIEMIKKKQQDIAETGYIFSINLIFICNLVIFALALSLLFSDVNFIDYVMFSIVETKEIFLSIFNQLFNY